MRQPNQTYLAALLPWVFIYSRYLTSEGGGGRAWGGEVTKHEKLLVKWGFSALQIFFLYSIFCLECIYSIRGVGYMTTLLMT